MRHQHLYSRQAPCNSLQGGNTSSTPKPPPACVPAAVVVQQGNICLNPPRPASTHTNTSANCRAHYQWLALQPQAPHTLHQQQVRQAAQDWLQSYWLKHGRKYAQKPNLVWSNCGPYALLAAAFCNNKQAACKSLQAACFKESCKAFILHPPHRFWQSCLAKYGDHGLLRTTSPNTQSRNPIER